ncbi:uncharacterized protein K452DRAFT_355813 [Aplosporella prunicola CBS 121167]|uniref:DH domain-containing protein n=1 Tax=Aplosporella prunicola CBS 121167 TaxID=1176127 RepID=A0A6A6BR88_9PEZI|nr:uncharacterized protein K452DRAFT_355813 [Aplosporella prunicola CBS 121167]KAF2145327.1 hypothetical protein K452DRAFT_355813 [Aplosporella prunicola CBS 121167]
MDPVTALGLTSSVVEITAHCLKAATALDELRQKYESAERTITAFCAESTGISASLSQVQSLLLRDPVNDPSYLKNRPELLPAFDTALTGCEVVYACLDEEIQRLVLGAVNTDNLTWKVKARFVWKEDVMKELLQQLRGQQAALNLLIQALQTTSLPDLRKLMQDNTGMLARVTTRSNSLRASHPNIHVPQSIFSKDDTTKASTEKTPGLLSKFEFEESVVNSRPYRRSLSLAKIQPTAAAEKPQEEQRVELTEATPKSERVQLDDFPLPPGRASMQEDSSRNSKEQSRESDEPPQTTTVEDNPPPLPPRKGKPAGRTHKPSASVYSVWPRAGAPLTPFHASSASVGCIPNVKISRDSNDEEVIDGLGEALSLRKNAVQNAGDARSRLSSEANVSIFSGMSDPMSSILDSSFSQASMATSPPTGNDTASPKKAAEDQPEPNQEGMAWAEDIIHFDEPAVTGPKLLTSQDLELSNLWQEVLLSEMQYNAQLQTMQSTFREPVSRKWASLDKHLEVLDHSKKISEIHTKELLQPLQVLNSEGNLTSGAPDAFVKWCREARASYRAYYLRHPHAQTAILITYEVDEKFRKFVKGLLPHAQERPNVNDLLAEPMRQMEYYHSVFTKAYTLSCASPGSHASQMSGAYAKTLEMIQRLKDSCERLYADSSRYEELQTLHRSIRTVNANLADPLHLVEAGRRIIHRGPLLVKPKGKGSWTQVHCVLLDNYLFWGRVDRAKEQWLGRYKNGERLWVLEPPMYTRYLQATVSTGLEKPMKASMMDNAPRGLEIFPFAAFTTSHSHLLGALSREQRQAWIDAIASLKRDDSQ